MKGSLDQAGGSQEMTTGDWSCRTWAQETRKDGVKDETERACVPSLGSGAQAGGGVQWRWVAQAGYGVQGGHGGSGKGHRPDVRAVSDGYRK